MPYLVLAFLLACVVNGSAASPMRRAQNESIQFGAGAASATPISCDNSTSFCPATSQCCKAQYSPSHWGCMANNACCTLGPHNAPSTTLPNCIVLGDSVSIGYTPDVVKALAGTCAVQHTPWDVSDGGAGSTSFALDCLDIFLATAQQRPVEWDVIFFNFGLHNLNNDSAAEDLYSAQLGNITQRLLKAGKKVLYGLTTPFMPDSRFGNHVVPELNQRASKIMAAQQPPIPITDLYSVVAKKCGPVPYVNCSICRVDPCSYHYNAEGYEMLAAAVSSAIKGALSDKAVTHDTVGSSRGEEGLPSPVVRPRHRPRKVGKHRAVPRVSSSQGTGKL